MCSLWVLVLLLTCIAALAHGRSVKGRSTKVSDKKKETWTFYLENNEDRMLITTEENGKLSDCYLSGDGYIIALALQTASPSETTKVNKRKMNALIELCTYAKWSGRVGSSGGELYQKIGRFSPMLIYPGTKWCGAGNVSDGYDDLGPERDTDMCCRDHDYCDDSIERFSSKYGLRNNSPFTKSNCKCDNKFYDCLTNVNTQTSNRVGEIYFNNFRMECFKLEHPAECSKYKGRIRPRCVEYQLDETQPPKWQWFDAKVYVRKSEDKVRQGLQSSKCDVFEYALQSEPAENGNSTDSGFDYWYNRIVTEPLEYVICGATHPPEIEGEQKVEQTDKHRTEKRYPQNGWPLIKSL